MMIHETLTEARKDARSKAGSLYVIEVDTTDGRTGYVPAKANIARIKVIIRQTGKSLPGIARMVREHSIHEPVTERDAYAIRDEMAAAWDRWQAASDRMDFAARRVAEAEVDALKAELAAL